MKVLDIPQSGKRGLTVSQGGRYGQISRALVIPSNPRTNAQVLVRSLLGNVAAKWSTLTQEQREAWTAAATKGGVVRVGGRAALWQRGPRSARDAGANNELPLAGGALNQQIPIA